LNWLCWDFWLRSFSQFFFPLAASLTQLPMLGPTAISSTVPAVGLAPGLLTPLRSFRLDRQLPALFTAEYQAFHYFCCWFRAWKRKLPVHNPLPALSLFALTR